MTYRKDILDQIESDLKDNLTRANGYTVQPVQVKRGLFAYTDFDEFPCMCFSVTSDTPYETNENGTDIRVLTVYIYAYARTDIYGRSEQINDMIQDIQNFLNNTTHFTYSDSTLIGNIEIMEGGPSQDRLGGWVECSIFYDSDNS